MFDSQRLLFAKGATWVCKGFKELDANFQQSSVAGLKKHKEDHNRAILKRGSITTHIRCTQISRLWICECSVDEGSHGCVGDRPIRVGDDCSGGLCLSVFELVTGDSFAAGTHREVVGPDLALRSDLRW